MSVRFLFGAALLVSFLNVRGFAEETTESRIAKYGDDLSAAWASYPSEKDMTVRKQKCTDLSSGLAAELSKLNAPENTTLQKAVDNYLHNLQRSKTLFRMEKMSAERQQYVAACQTVFRRELSFVTDGATERTASKCFALLVEWCESARSTLVTVPEDSRAPFYQGLTDAFNIMLKNATKDTGDATAIYDQQLKEVRRKFPVTNPTFQKTNQPIASLLEGAAKNLDTFNNKK